MKLKCIGTGSSGNCYCLVDNNNLHLLLDAGLPIKDIKIGIDFNISFLLGALITHVHKDHYFSVNPLRNMGIPVITPFEEIDDKELRNIIPFAPQFSIKMVPLKSPTGNWLHSNGDSSECPCYGYLLEHEEMGRLLYITDTAYVPYRFKNIDHVLLGVNYSQQMLSEIEDIKGVHVYNGHLALETAVDFVKAISEQSTLKNVIMCHLSTSNADENYFIEEMKKVVNCPVNVLSKGMTIELSRGEE